MFEKAIVHSLLQTMLKYGRVCVEYWDADVRRYEGREGLCEPELRVAITNPQFVRKLLQNVSLAVGEGYMDRWLVISEDQLPLFFKLVARNQPDMAVRQPFRRRPNRKEVQRGYIETHYDVGNEYYNLFLDSTRLYSCAYFRTEDDTLEEAQIQKIDYLLRKLRLKPGMRLLDIGCGWGHLAVAAARQYGVRVMGITLSSEQLKGARELAEREGVSDLVGFELVNYQELDPDWWQFDRIVSVGMFEHVGRGNGDQYFAKVAELLKPGGVSVLHTITQLISRPTDPWIDKYVFPGGHLPTRSEIEKGLERQGLWARHSEDLSEHYARTLRYWRERHRVNRDKIVDMFDERFYRMRDLWLAGSEAGFRYGKLGLMQVIFTNGKPDEGTWPLTNRFLYE